MITAEWLFDLYFAGWFLWRWEHRWSETGISLLWWVTTEVFIINPLVAFICLCGFKCPHPSNTIISTTPARWHAGRKLDHLGLEEALGGCLLSDDEYALGSGKWQDFEVCSIALFRCWGDMSWVPGHIVKVTAKILSRLPFRIRFPPGWWRDLMKVSTTKTLAWIRMLLIAFCSFAPRPTRPTRRGLVYNIV